MGGSATGCIVNKADFMGGWASQVDCGDPALEACRMAGRA